MTRLIACLCLSLSAGLVGAATVWNPAGNDIRPPAMGDWGVAANWTQGPPVVAGAPGREKAVFNVRDAAECVVTDARTFHYFVQGDNGPGGVIRIVEGGSLTTGNNWSGVGYNDSAKLIVEAGGAANFGEHMWIGFTAGGIGTFQLDGGTVNVAGMFGLGWNGGAGFAGIRNGTLNLSGFDGTQSIGSGSLMDIAAGIVVINGDHRKAVGRAGAFSRGLKFFLFSGKILVAPCLEWG